MSWWKNCCSVVEHLHLAFEITQVCMQISGCGHFGAHVRKLQKSSQNIANKLSSRQSCGGCVAAREL